MAAISTGTDFPTDGNIVPDSNWRWHPSTSPLTYEHSIQGKMFMVSFTASDILMIDKTEDVWKQEIKKQLAIDLAEKMLEEGAIEFTQIQDSAWGHKIIKARCFLIPDNQVRILRTLYKDK
jgi:hypothetical protein